MPQDIEGLSVTLNAKIDQFKKDMNEAVRTFDQGSTEIERRNQQMTENINRNMQSMAVSSRFLAGVVRGLFSVTAALEFVHAIEKAATAMGKLANQAQDTRLSAGALAGLQITGRQQGVSESEIDAALAHFTAVSKKAKDDAEEFYKALGNIGPQFVKQFQQAETQGARLETIARAYKSTNDEVKRAQLLIQGFGTDNERLGSVLDQVASGLDSVAKKAEALGIHLDDDFVEKAAKASRELETLADVGIKKLQISLANLAPFLATTIKELQVLSDYAKTIGDVVYAVAGTVAQGISRDLGLGTDGSQDAAEQGGGGADDLGRPLTVRRRAFRPRPSLKDRGGTSQLDAEAKRIERETRSYEGQAAAVGKVGEALYKAETMARIYEAAQQAGVTLTDAQKEKYGKLADELARLKNAFHEAKLESDLLFERQQIGRTADEQAVQSRLRAEQIDETTAKGKELADTMRENINLLEAKDTTQSFVKGLITDLENGVKAGKALENQLKRIADKLLDKSLDAIISSAFGAFGPKGGGATDFGVVGSSIAEGDVLTAAGGGIVGRIGSTMRVPLAAFRGARHFQAGGGVPAIVHAGELILNQAQQKNVAASMTGKSGPIQLTHAPVINGVGLSREEVFAVMQRSQKEFARNIGPIFSDWQRRHG
jgi:hypothetical protein